MEYESEGYHHIELDKSINPVIHPPRRVPIALQERLKSERERMEKLGIVEKVEHPTEWVSSIVIVEKTDGKLRICLDPKDLNRSIKREHFILPRQEEITAKLAGAKYFSKLDASSGFWNIKLDEEMWGCTKEEHDKRLKEVLERIRTANLKLRRDECEIGISEVTYFGHREKRWEPAVVVQKTDNSRSYIVKTENDKLYRRNRKHLMENKNNVVIENDDLGTEPIVQQNTVQIEVNDNKRTRSGRMVRKPERLIENMN
ncbi:unnamed protein product [Mytilus coruscus]|uniref:Reverse transcriptase domain-containing protein n=1 Tax=Mytilus coruscus TaxID=42192 RepID=A0A6J8DVC6_MYTCO|nr:unnamed protein product [Mytilus coruscus]